jgi:hypothetical protein
MLRKLQGLVGTRGTGTAQIRQSGASLTATTTNDTTGNSYSCTGTAGTSSVALNTQSCSASDASGVRCPASTVLRHVRLQTGAINATVSGTSMTNYAFSANRR